jgi:hypothetical protein
MEMNENFVEQTENVEVTTEETPVKMFTQEEVNTMMGKAKARARAKIEKEYQRKYGDLEEVLKAGTGKESVEEMTDTFKQFYQKKGIHFPEKPTYSDNDISVLASADAEEIIRSGYEEVVEEVDRLADIGVANMTAREKALFKTLAEYRNNADRGRELTKIGVTEDVYDSKEFKDFAGKFAPTTPIRDIYDIYAKTQPKKNIKPMGSMKNTTGNEGAVKDFYTPEEARSFSRKYLDEHPEVFKAIENSMIKWKR